jgi:hypothetical protein
MGTTEGETSALSGFSTKITAQYAYGIKYMKPVHREIARLEQVILSEMDSEFQVVPNLGKNAVVLYAMGAMTKQFRERLATVLKSLEDSEVRYIGLQFATGTQPLKELKQDQSKFIDGVSDPTNNLTEKAIREKLLPGLKRK